MDAGYPITLDLTGRRALVMGEGPSRHAAPLGSSPPAPSSRSSRRG